MQYRVAFLVAGLALATVSCGLPVTRGPSQKGVVRASNDECPSGICVDGVYCATSCEGTCVAYAVEGSEGPCTNVPDGADPRDA
ncbi:MAG: hypothetical protein IRZ16_14855 [Myxococcaceae bacterium]|nr:hypothetical protein [Myxococcaceae bacterium]